MESKPRKLNILLVIGWPLGQGGHINSTLALSKPLVSYKEVENVYLLAPKGEKVEYFTKANIKYLSLPNYNKIWLFRLVTALYIVFYSVRFRISVIHAMDYKSLVSSVLANLLLWKPLIFTKAGGKPLNIKLPSLSSLIVFSKELLDFYKDTPLSSNKNISLIKERIDLDEFEEVALKQEVSNDFSIFMAMRLSPAKKVLLDSFFSSLDNLKFPDEVISVSIAGDGSLKDECEEKSRLIAQSNNNIKFNFLGQINNKAKIYDYFLNSSITVGHGRGIMEAMALGKPVVLLGFDKVASTLVNKNNVGVIADNNFSGRKIEEAKESINLAELICSDNRKEILDSAGKFNITYINDYYSSKIGAKKHKTIYLKADRPQMGDFKQNFNWLINRFLGS